MGLQQLEDKFAELIALNDRFGEWEDEFTEKLDAGKLISIKFFELLKKTPIDWNTVWLVNSIATITLDDDNDNAEYVLNKAIDRYVIKSFERKKVGYSLVARDDTPIRIIQLTDFVPSLDEDTKKRLHSMQREGYCHWDSIHLVQNLEVPCKIVSGYCTTQSKKMPYPHTWVEVEHQGTEWVLDFTLNLAMNKDGYYKLHNPQNTTSIDSTTLIEDLKLRKRTSFDEKDIRMYLFYPNEARRAMQEEIKSHRTYETGEFPWIIIEQ